MQETLLPWLRKEQGIRRPLWGQQACEISLSSSSPPPWASELTPPLSFTSRTRRDCKKLQKTPRFSILHFSTFSFQNNPQKRSQKCSKSSKSVQETPPNLALNSYLHKGSPKCENRIPFNVLSLFPKVQGTLKSVTIWTPNGPRNSKL